MADGKLFIVILILTGNIAQSYGLFECINSSKMKSILQYFGSGGE